MPHACPTTGSVGKRREAQVGTEDAVDLHRIIASHTGEGDRKRVS